MGLCHIKFSDCIRRQRLEVLESSLKQGWISLPPRTQPHLERASGGEQAEDYELTKQEGRDEFSEPPAWTKLLVYAKTFALLHLTSRTNRRYFQ